MGNTTDSRTSVEECLFFDSETPCRGEVELHAALSGTGTLIAYCATHWDEAVIRDQEHRQIYPDSDVPPSWFDPDAAGERWNDDY